MCCSCCVWVCIMSLEIMLTLFVLIVFISFSLRSWKRCFHLQTHRKVICWITTVALAERVDLKLLFTSQVIHCSRLQNISHQMFNHIFYFIFCFFVCFFKVLLVICIELWVNHKGIGFNLCQFMAVALMKNSDGPVTQIVGRSQGHWL